MKLIKAAIVLFLPAAVVATLAAGLVYAAVQQAQRADANDPQIQLAEDAAARLSAGAAPSDVVAPAPGGSKVDLAASLAPFVVVYDASGAVLATNGQLDGHDPVIPAGVRQAAQQTGRDLVTWQPRAGVRIATVTLPWSGGTVMSGRSLREVEDRESRTLQIAIAAGLVILAAAAVASLAAARIARSF